VGFKSLRQIKVGNNEKSSKVIYSVVDLDNYNENVVIKETKQYGIWTVYKRFKNNANSSTGVGTRAEEAPIIRRENPTEGTEGDKAISVTENTPEVS
jgi:orotidine-5'-phosphate decarboxylase